MVSRCLFLVAALGLLASCKSPDLAVMTALNDSWAALEPYTRAGIEADAGLGEDAKKVLLDEATEFGLTLAEELKHAK